MQDAPRPPAVATILFVCLHGSAKSVIAAEHLNRLARARGALLRGQSVGIEPDDTVPPHVVAGLAEDGIDVLGYAPRQATADHLAMATRIVSFGCDVSTMLSASTPVEQWDDVPM